jgi:hypothetical protein
VTGGQTRTASLDNTYERITTPENKKDKQFTNKEAEAWYEALPLDENDVVSITKSKTAKRKQNSGASSTT